MQQYAFDVLSDTFLSNKRTLYVAPDWIPDGLKVGAGGLLLIAAGHGLDVLDPADGTILLRVQTNYTVANFAWTGLARDGSGRAEVWLMGFGGVSRVRWALGQQQVVT